MPLRQRLLIFMIEWKELRYAARHLRECRALETSISDHRGFETHDAFLTRLQARHGRKTSFWSQVTELG